MQNLDPKSLWHRKGLILSLTLGAMAAGGLYSTTARKVYQSEARVVVVRQQNPAAVRPLATERYFLATQAEIMGSPLIVERAIERLSRPVGRPTAELLEDVRITPMDDTDVLTVVVRDSDPRTAAELVDAIVESFADYTRDVDQKRTGSTVAAMVQRERELSQAIDEAQAEYTRVRAESSPAAASRPRSR